MHISDQIFDGWVRKHQRLLFGIAYWWTGSRSDAEELTQETFFQAYRSRTSLHDLESAKGWLVGILRHCYAQMRRKHASAAEISIEEMSHSLEHPAGPDTQTLALHQSLAKLEERYRLPVVMFYFKDLSYRDIAQALELPIGTVMSRLSRARKLLFKHLDARHKPVLVRRVNEL